MEMNIPLHLLLTIPVVIVT